MSCTNWYSPIGLPNVCRSRAYSTDRSRQARITPRRRLQRGHVRAGRRLGEPEACELLGARLRCEPALLLLLAPVAQQRQRVQTDVDRDQRAEGRLATLDLLA